uniref:Uncharacterized protein n=1 Tax=Hyaloperonospora arabidopsidis (strain Emoy2) TaxID=559515 RepID=M4BT49_HYAAE
MAWSTRFARAIYDVTACSCKKGVKNSFFLYDSFYIHDEFAKVKPNSLCKHRLGMISNRALNIIQIWF